MLVRLLRLSFLNFNFPLTPQLWDTLCGSITLSPSKTHWSWGGGLKFQKYEKEKHFKVLFIKQESTLTLYIDQPHYNQY